MSVTMANADGVTVFTLTTDPDSSCPPICQIFKGLCYSPTCCSVSQHLKKVQGVSQSALASLHIMVGLLNIGLGVILVCSRVGSWYQMDESGFPFWCGGIFILFGIVGILSHKFPSPCLVILNMILNLLAGVSIAIAAIVLYSINMSNIRMWWFCRDDDYSYYRHTTESPEVQRKCLEGRELLAMLLKSVNAVLIVLSILELFVALSCASLGIKALISKEKKGITSTGDPEVYNPLLEEVSTGPTA